MGEVHLYSTEDSTAQQWYSTEYSTTQHRVQYSTDVELYSRRVGWAADLLLGLLLELLVALLVPYKCLLPCFHLHATSITPNTSNPKCQSSYNFPVPGPASMQDSKT